MENALINRATGVVPTYIHTTPDAQFIRGALHLDQHARAVKPAASLRLTPLLGSSGGNCLYMKNDDSRSQRNGVLLPVSSELWNGVLPNSILCTLGAWAQRQPASRSAVGVSEPAACQQASRFKQPPVPRWPARHGALNPEPEPPKLWSLQGEVLEYYPPPAVCITGQGEHPLPAVLRVPQYTANMQVCAWGGGACRCCVWW